jgi:hypothetical protein
MRKSAGKMFATGFLKSLLFLILFTLITVGSYKIVMHFYGVEDFKEIEVIPPVKKQTVITEARIDDVSKHLIYCVDEESGDITGLILEIFNGEDLMLYYVTIPIKSQLTLSDALHRELVLIKPSIPSFLKLSAITGYLPKENVYGYGVLMIEELLDIQISYYTVVPQSIYNTVFETEAIKRRANNQKKSENTFPREVFLDSFIQHLYTINTESELRNYIEELYSKITSNLSFEDKLNYMEGYLNIPGKNIVFEVIDGVDSNSAYTINESAAAKQLKAYLGE